MKWEMMDQYILNTPVVKVRGQGAGARSAPAPIWAPAIVWALDPPDWIYKVLFYVQRQISWVWNWVWGIAPTWLRQVRPPASHGHFNHCDTQNRIWLITAWVRPIHSVFQKAEQEYEVYGQLYHINVSSRSPWWNWNSATLHMFGGIKKPGPISPGLSL